MSSNRLKVLLVSLFTVFAVSAVGSASASAAECAGGKQGGVQYCVSGSEILDGEVLKNSDLVMEGTAKLKSKIGTTAVTIECKTIALNHELLTFEDSGAGKGEIHFTECGIAGAPKCTVTVPAFKFNSELTTDDNAGRIETELSPASGETFVIIAISGTGCAFGTINLEVKGTQQCENDKTNAEAEEERNSSLEHDSEPAKWHKLICKGTGSELKLGAQNAEFEGTFALEGPETDLAWSVKAS